MGNIERKIYSLYAFTENSMDKARINAEIYEELKKKWRICQGPDVYNPDKKVRERVNLADYDLVYTRKSMYHKSQYHIVKNATDMTASELALVFDHGNLCFGYSKINDFLYEVSEN